MTLPKERTMSICAHILVLFRQKAPADRISQVEEAISNRIGYALNVDPHPYGRLVEIDDADLHADVNDDGSLRWNEKGRQTPFIGVPSIQGRLFGINYLTRHWSPDYSEGPVADYAITLLTLLAQPDVEGVWFVSDYYFAGGTAPKQTHQSVHEMLDTFVQIGATFGGKPARYVRSEDGYSIQA